VCNHSIRCAWSPNLQTVQLCRNINPWTDKSKDLAARMSTFEAPSHLTQMSEVSKVRARQVKKSTMSLIRHVNALLPSGYSCWNAVFSFKINPDGNLLFLSCSSMQIRNTAQISPGFLPRAYNHPDERPAIVYSSEHDRQQRIAAIQKEPEKQDLWEMLTKHDRQALQHLRTAAGSLVEYDDKLGGWRLSMDVGYGGHEKDCTPPLQSVFEKQASQDSLATASEPAEEKQCSLLPKTRRRNLQSYFASIDNDSENEAFSASVFSTKFGALVLNTLDKGVEVLKKSSHNLATEVIKVTEAAPDMLMQHMPLPLVKANSLSEHSYKKNSCGVSGVASGVGLLEEKLLKTRKWAANQSGVVGRGGPFDPFDRVGTPRLASNSPAQDSGGSMLNMCVMPSAVCLHRSQPIARGKMTSINYRQVLAILAPKHKPIMAHILAKGSFLRQGPDNFDKDQLIGKRQPTAVTRTSGEGASATTNEWKRPLKEFKWMSDGAKPLPHDLILRTLLQVQQGQLNDVSIADMTTDENFLRKTLEVCEDCGLLVNRWAQFHVDVEAQGNTTSAHSHVSAGPSNP
jgi:hypothetical protein